MKDFLTKYQFAKVRKASIREVETKEPFSWCKFEDEHPLASTLLMAFGQAVFVACAATVAVACFYL